MSINNKNNALDKAYRINDTIIVFIGLGMIWIPLVTNIFGGTVPQEFLFGATLSSFLLALSDGILITENMTKLKIWFYGFSFIGGILSVIYLPVVLNMFPRLLDILNPLSSDLTLMALGFVLMVVGARSFTYKMNVYKEIRKDFETLAKDVESFDTLIEEVKQSNEHLSNSLTEKSDQINKIEIQLKEIEEEKNRLMSENEELKKLN